MKNRIKGCLIGGACGDALGYAVEFKRYQSILNCYGQDGIKEYDLTYKEALISDDTQMTLFTAVGMLVNEAAPTSNFKKNIYLAYLDWYETQHYDRIDKNKRISWIRTNKKLNCRRAPGNTCVNALYERMIGISTSPINDSKGCGGVMRVAPIGLAYASDSKDSIIKKGAVVAKITHGHPLGYIPAGMLSLIIHTIMFDSENKNLEEIIVECLKLTVEFFKESEYIDFFEKMILNAIDLTKNDLSDFENITTIGEGWVAEEAIAVAIYSALKYENDFSKCICSAVNHNGDSDSTGAIAGNILGAWVGLDKIEDRWIKDLELVNVIDIICDDLYEMNIKENDEWKSKYR